MTAFYSAQHDELANLFASQLRVSQAPAVQPTRQRNFNEPVAVPSVRKSALPIDFASCHYTGTAYIQPDVISQPSCSPPPPYSEVYLSRELTDTLRRHSIDPTSLSPNQVSLFQNADYDQKLRLLELWRISPPSPPRQHVQVDWQMETSIEKEETAARERYEQAWRDMSAKQIGVVVIPSHAAAIEAPSVHYMDAEPYIADGYQQANQYPPHMEPVYGANQSLWQTGEYNNVGPTQLQRTELHYGLDQQIRNHADWERMNQAIAQERLAGFSQRDDEEML